MFFKKVSKSIVQYLIKCLITPLCITFGVVLVMFIMFNSKISYIYAFSNMLVFVEAENEKNLYDQVSTPIVTQEIEQKEVEIKYPLYGDKFAELSIKDLGLLNSSVFNCDDYSQLKYGWGRSFITRYPGEGGKIVLAGHLVLFRKVLNIKLGTEIVFKTTYGKYIYRVIDTKIVEANDESIMLSDDSIERLVMYICYPAKKLEIETKRFIIISELVKGPKAINIPFKD